MKRRDVISRVGAVALAWPFGVRAQQPTKVFRIGYVSPTVTGGGSFGVFREALGRAGYVIGRNLVLETRFAQGRSETLPALVAELLRENLDVLVAGSTPAAIAARAGSATVPIVFAGVNDPVAAGLVSNLARPGGNITGISVGVSEDGFTAKCLQLLKDAVPGLERLAVMLNPSHPSSAQFLRDIELSARSLAMTFATYDVRDATQLETALAAVGASGAQGLFVAPDAILTDNSAKIAQFAAGRRLPTFHFSRRFVDAGGLMSYGANIDDSYRRAATYVDRILKGTRPADLPVERPSRFELVINLKTAKALGLAVPGTLLSRANDVVE